MTKIQIKSEKLTPFGGAFSIMERFEARLVQTIDSALGSRCTFFCYQYSEILRALMCLYLCGDSCAEVVYATFLLCKEYVQYNELCRFANKIPLNPIGCGFEVIFKSGELD